LQRFSQTLAEQRRKREKEEKHRANLEFLEALKKSREARKIMPEFHDPEVDLAFKLQQAVTRNQEIVKRIVANSSLLS